MKKNNFVYLLIHFFIIHLNANEKWMKFENPQPSSNQQMYTPQKTLSTPTIKGLENIKITKPNEIVKISNKHRIIKEYYSNSKLLKKQTSYLGNQKDGAEFEYYSNGQIMVKTHYSNGKKHGVETIFDDTGKVYKKYFYINGEKQGDK